MNLKGRSFLKLLDFTPAEITYLLGLAAELKAKKKAGIPHRIHEGKNIALLFEKDSTRTRCAFEVAGHDLGMGVTYLGPTGSQMGKKESIADTARVLGRMYDGIEYRGYAQTIVEQLAKFSGVPVWNGLTLFDQRGIGEILLRGTGHEVHPHFGAAHHQGIAHVAPGVAHIHQPLAL